MYRFCDEKILKEGKMKALGTQILVEFYGCDKDALNNKELIKREMNIAALKSGATVVENMVHNFNPYGVSGVVVIKESHLTIHTWPEYGYAAVDLFTCGESIKPWEAFSHIKEILKADKITTIEMKRGQLHDITENFKPTCLS